MGERGGTTLYFAYGSCMDDARLKEHGVDHLFQDVVGAGVVHGFRLAFTRRTRGGDRAYADIVPDPGHAVEGKIYRLPPAAVAYLDRREGRGTVYDRIWLNVEAGGKILSPVLSYTVIHKCDPELPPPKRYAEEILRGASGIVSPHYLRQLKRRLREQFGLTV